MSDMTVHCPKCDGVDIYEKNVAYAELEVWGWELDKDGQLQPTDYNTDARPDWEAEDVARQYVCHNPRCKHECSLDQLVVRNTDISEPPNGR